VVVLLEVEVVAEDFRTQPDVEIRIAEQAVFHAEFPWPERHDLHQADRAGRRYGMTVEAAFHVHHRQQQFGRHPQFETAFVAVTTHHALGVAVDVGQQFGPLCGLADEPCQLAIVEAEEHFLVESVGVLIAPGIANGGAQDRTECRFPMGAGTWSGAPTWK